MIPACNFHMSKYSESGARIEFIIQKEISRAEDWDPLKPMKVLVIFSVELEKSWVLSLHILMQLFHSLEDRSP